MDEGERRAEQTLNNAGKTQCSLKRKEKGPEVRKEIANREKACRVLQE